MQKRIIVTNLNSYYHEGFWQGREKKFCRDKNKAKRFEIHAEAKDEVKYIKENVTAPSTSVLIISD